MRWSEAFIPTLKEEPKEAEIASHSLLLRAGYIRKTASGIYSYLPLAQKVLSKISSIVREEMNREGAQEVILPVLQPKELWEKSGRWEEWGKELMRISDRNQREFGFGPTHEEVITDLVGREIKSYRQLPLILYQIQVKFRDEVRPRFGVIRCREFLMKDAYSFDADIEGMERSYLKMYRAYERILQRCGLDYRVVEADPGLMGGEVSHEFMAMASQGEDLLAYCEKCGYAANEEMAECGENEEVEEEEEKPLQKIDTPNITTIEELTGFLGVPPRKMVKTLIYMGGGEPIAFLIRGDRRINEAKLRRYLGTGNLHLADASTIERLTRAPVGFTGPVGLKEMRIIADKEVMVMGNFITGANEKDRHYLNVNPGRDFKVDGEADIRYVSEGDLCPRCGNSLIIAHGIELGHIFKLGEKYSRSLGATFLGRGGKEKFLVMGCYGIGVSRIMAAVVEQNHDEEGIIWPFSLTPFQVLLLPVNMERKEIVDFGENLYRSLKEKGVDVLLDDRAELPPGVRFKDADLIGIPLRVTIGLKRWKEGRVEVYFRREREARVVDKEKVEEEIYRRII